MSIFTTEKIVAEIKEKHKSFFTEFEKKIGRKAILGIVRIGENKVSDSYVRIKKRYAEVVGVEVREVWIDEKLEQKEVEEKVSEVVGVCDGVIVQLPIPTKFDTTKVIRCVEDSKDIDQLNLQAKSHFIQPVVFSILKILEFLQMDLENKKVAVLGQGRLVGKPFSQYLDKLHIAHTKLSKANSEQEILRYIKTADLLVTGVGIASYVKSGMVKENSIVIDAGTSEDGDTIVGDVVKDVGEVASVLVTTPGGVGPLTVCGLFNNLKIAVEMQIN